MTYGHLVRERHERDVDHLDAVLWGVNSAGDEGGTLESDDAERPATSHCVPPATGRSLSTEQSGGELLVEGKGFVYPSALNIRYFVAVILQNAAN